MRRGRSPTQVIQGPKALRNNLKRLRRLSRQHSRKVKGSNNRKKSALKLARLHLRITNLRLDHTHKLTTRLCRENQAVGIEELNVKGMVRNRRLSRSISDEGWGEFRWQLEYKAPMHGADLIVFSQWYPSSKACHVCGLVRDSLPLKIRKWTCEGCNTTHDRDLNAALNLEPNTPGHGGIYACGDCSSGLDRPSGPQVKLQSLKQESSGCQPEMVAV